MSHVQELQRLGVDITATWEGWLTVPNLEVSVIAHRHHLRSVGLRRPLKRDAGDANEANFPGAQRKGRQNKSGSPWEVCGCARWAELESPPGDCPDAPQDLFDADGSQRYGINAGAVVLETSREEFGRMAERLADEDHRSHETTGGPEQDFLTRFCVGACALRGLSSVPSDPNRIFWSRGRDEVRTWMFLARRNMVEGVAVTRLLSERWKLYWGAAWRCPVKVQLYRKVAPSALWEQIYEQVLCTAMTNIGVRSYWTTP